MTSSCSNAQHRWVEIRLISWQLQLPTHPLTNFLIRTIFQTILTVQLLFFPINSQQKQKNGSDPVNPGVQAWSILSSEDVLRPHTSFSLESSSSVGVKGCRSWSQRSGFRLYLSVEGLRLSLQAPKLHLDEVGQRLPHFQLKSIKNTITMETHLKGNAVNIRRGVISRTSSLGEDLPHLTWLLFSARRASTSSFTLNGLPTSTVILWKGQTRAVTWTHGSRQPPWAVCVLPSRYEACRASRWAERRSDLKVSTVRTLPPASGGSHRGQRRACVRTPTLVLTHVPERQDDGMERALGY